jgi:integrase
MTVVKRNKTYQYSGTIAGARLRFSLGTRLPQAANTLSRQIGAALAEGPDSPHWRTLKTVLPKASWEILTANRGVKPSPQLSEFETAFSDKLDRRVKLGELAERSRDLYAGTATMFFQYLADHDVKTLGDISSARVEDYLVQRKEDILKRGGNGKGIQTDYTVLQSIFNFAQGEGLIRQSPLKIKHKTEEKKPDDERTEPFTKEEITQLSAAAKEEVLTAFLLLKNTGLRGGDVSDLTWESFDKTNRCLTVQTKKRKKWTTIPLTEGFFQYLSDLAPDPPAPGEKILPGMNRGKLYRTMAVLGKEAGVSNANPHRFRHTLAVTILERGGTIFDVARILGDEVSTVDKYYSKYTDELQERVRRILED